MQLLGVWIRSPFRITDWVCHCKWWSSLKDFYDGGDDGDDDYDDGDDGDDCDDGDDDDDDGDDYDDAHKNRMWVCKWWWSEWANFIC